MLSTALPSNWSVHEAQDFWPVSISGIFLAKALQRLGHLSHPDWVGEEPQWANHERRPKLPEASSAFRDDEPVHSVHERFAGTIRSILSPAAFRAEHLHQQIRAKIQVREGTDELLQEQLRVAELRAELGEDREDPVTHEHWAHVWWESATINSEIEGAERRLPAVATNLLLLTQSGHLKTFARPIAGGASVAIPPEAWEITSGLPRLASCAINLAAAPRDADQPPTHWIFVDQVDLDREMHEIDEESARNRLKQEAPLTRLTEATLNECATWLLMQFEDASTAAMPKDELFAQAKKVFPNVLSRRGFNRAWAAVAGDYPDRTKSGPRLKANSKR